MWVLLEILQSPSPHKGLRQRAPVIYILSAGCQSHRNLSASRCFCKDPSCCSCVMGEGTDCLAELVRRASLYLFFSWSSKSKWDNFIHNVVVLEVKRIFWKWMRCWVITSVTERDRKWCHIQSVNHQVSAVRDRLWAWKQTHLDGGFHTSVFCQRGRVWKFFFPWNSGNLMCMK